MPEVRFLRINERVLVNVSAIRFVTLYDAEGAVVVEGGGEMRVHGEHLAGLRALAEALELTQQELGLAGERYGLPGTVAPF